MNDALQSIVHLDAITSNLETIVVEKNATIQDVLQQILKVGKTAGPDKKKAEIYHALGKKE